MNIYPALKARMGTWTYYVIKMSARELSENVHFASEIYEDKTLSQAIQRILNESRVNKEIVTYLKRQPDHFFASIVIAALEGDPKFYPVTITDDPRFEMLHDDKRLNEAYGVLKFDGTQKYYALDGQHRLAAIKTLLNRNNPLSDGAPQDFASEEFSIILVVPRKDDSNDIFLQKYRRLFANLNRYAKPMDQATNIIMDEDDAFAIITRRLITEHSFFQSQGHQRKSIRIKTDKGKNLKTGDAFFTSIEALYAINIELLKSRERENNGWGINDDAKEKDFENFKRFRPNEELIDTLYDELVTLWDAILEEIPELRQEPSRMRTHDLVDEDDNQNETDHLLFWPIGQEMLAKIVRELLDGRLQDTTKISNKDEIKGAIKGLGKLEWRLHKFPWRFFVLVRDDRNKWKMRNEERTAVMRLAQRVILWLLDYDKLDGNEVLELKKQWATYLFPSQAPDDVENYWNEIYKIKLT